MTTPSTQNLKINMGALIISRVKHHIQHVYCRSLYIISYFANLHSLCWHKKNALQKIAQWHSFIHHKRAIKSPIRTDIAFLLTVPAQYADEQGLRNCRASVQSGCFCGFAAVGPVARRYRSIAARPMVRLVHSALIATDRKSSKHHTKHIS